MSTVSTYIDKINQLYQTGTATEHSYRPDLKVMLDEIVNNSNIQVINEAKRIRNVGAPDYHIKKGEIPIGYIEAKDIGMEDLEGKKKNKEQFNRYKNALDNLIITDYLEFYFYKNGEFIQKISIAKIEENQIKPIEENF
ncbi:MAG: hypothetical protein OIF32_04575, partial [Campylobacterales bacterium]|nr:hypothetical protein [Campylobacterales bacterium]